MQQQGDAILNWQTLGQLLGNVAFQSLPAFPHEQGFFPFPLPRALAWQAMGAVEQLPSTGLTATQGISPQPAAMVTTQQVPAPPSFPPPPAPKATPPAPRPSPPPTSTHIIMERRGL